MPYRNPIPARADWQAIREGAKVPKGAAKVSIGDDLEKVAKSLSLDTISANLKDTQKLIADLDIYIAAVKKKYPAFEAIVTTKVKKKAESHLAFLLDIVKAKTEYYPRYSAAEKTWGALKKGTGKPKDLGGKLQQLKGCVDAFALLDAAWEAKRPTVQQMFQLCDSVATLTKEQETALDNLFKLLAV